MNTTSQTKTDQQLFERAKAVSPGGVHSPVRAFKSVGGTPLFFEKSNGATLTSVEGKTYIDFCQAFGPNILGHRDPDVAKAVHHIVDTIWSIGACEPYSLELAEYLTSRIPALEKVRFVSSGTEAVMSALRVARGATGRKKILKFDGCYHGHVDSMLVKAGSGLAGVTAADSAGVSNDQDTLIAPLDDEAAVEKIFKEWGSQIAAVILEPLPANYGLLIQRKEFLHYVVKCAKEAGALVIFDEVISGFRVSPGGMAEVLGVTPDLITYGKVVGGGFPLGAFGGKKDLMNCLAPEGPVYQAGTLSANPVSVTAGLATLLKMEKENVISVINERARKFVQQLNEGFTKVGFPFSVVRMGSIFWIHANMDGDNGGDKEAGNCGCYCNNSGHIIRSFSKIPAAHREKFPKFFHAALAEGVYLAPSAFEVGFVSYAHTDDILKVAAEKIIKAAQSTLTSS